MMRFIWDAHKELENILKHGVDFETAKKASFDSQRRITVDAAHSTLEDRFYCVGKVHGRIVTVRFTLRGQDIRIIGAGYWRKGKKVYEKDKGSI